MIRNKLLRWIFSMEPLPAAGDEAEGLKAEVGRLRQIIREATWNARAAANDAEGRLRAGGLSQGQYGHEKGVSTAHRATEQTLSDGGDLQSMAFHDDTKKSSRLGKRLDMSYAAICSRGNRARRAREGWSTVPPCSASRANTLTGAYQASVKAKVVKAPSPTPVITDTADAVQRYLAKTVK